MKKLLLVVALFVSGVSAAVAQTCTPLQSWADTVDYGAYPDTITNFPFAEINVFYSTDLNFKVPATVTAELDPSGTFVGTPIQGFVVDSVVGLPAGLDFACSAALCEYAGGANGCANIFGTPTVAGTYPVEIFITATVLVTVPLVGQVPVEQQTSFTGYKIVVGTAGTIEAVLDPIKVQPNPASDKITVSGLSSALKVSSMVVTNMEGKVVRNVEVSASTVDVNLNGLENGIYFVVVNHSAGTETIKFIKQ